MIHFFRTFIDPKSPERAKLAIHLIAQGVSADATPAEEAVAQEEVPVPSNGAELVIIENVRDYKAGLVVSAGARPTQQLSEFEDSDAKL